MHKKYILLLTSYSYTDSVQPLSCKDFLNNKPVFTQTKKRNSQMRSTYLVMKSDITWDFSSFHLKTPLFWKLRYIINMLRCLFQRIYLSWEHKRSKTFLKLISEVLFAYSKLTLSRQIISYNHFIKLIRRFRLFCGLLR